MPIFLLQLSIRTKTNNIFPNLLGLLTTILV